MRAGAFFFIFILFLGLPVLLFAQANEDEPEYETDWGDYTADLYTTGDQTVTVSLGVIFPTVFASNGNIWEPGQPKIDPPVGGGGFLAYSYYLNSLFFVGGEIGGMFFPTIAKNTLFLVFLGAKAGIQLNIWKLEFPISLAVGMSWHTHLSQTNYGLYLKGGFGAYYRAMPSWSFGLTANWYWMPERPADPAKNVDGNFIDLMLSARYHF